MKCKSIEKIIEEGIRKAEIRNKERLRDIALGIRGRHSMLIEFYEGLRQGFSGYDYEYLIYFPMFPKSSVEIVSVISRKHMRAELVTPITYKGIFNKIDKLDTLFSHNEMICDECDMLSNYCRFYFCNFKLSNMCSNINIVLIGEILAEVIEISKIPQVYVFMRKLPIPPNIILSALPNFKIYNGILFMLTKINLEDNKIKNLCRNIQIEYRKLLNMYERRLVVSNSESGYVPPVVEDENISDYKTMSYPPLELYDIDKLPGKINNRIFVGGRYTFMPLLKEICKTVFNVGYQPIFANDCKIPVEDTHDSVIRLLHNCKYAIFEVTASNGQSYEIENIRSMNIDALIIYSIIDKNNPKLPPTISSMLKTFTFPKIIMKGYSTIDEMKETIVSWIRGLKEKSN